MNNNSELGNNNSASNVTDPWKDILPKENFYQSRQNSQEAPKTELSDEEIKQKIIAKRRIERLKKRAEAREKAKRVATVVLSIAFTALALFKGAAAAGPKDDFLKSEQARQKVIEMENVQEISFHGNIRSNPETTNSEDSNIYKGVDDEVSFTVPDGSTVYYYRDENDPNGGWIGIPVKDLEDQSFISKREANKMEKDGDNTVWINDGNATTKTK